MVNTLRKILIIARYTFSEIYKSKVMLNVVLLSIALGVVSYIAAEFTYGVPGKVALDFGLGALTLSCVGIAIFMGSSLISKEVESRTIYMALSRPIPRWSFLLGRLMGMGFFLALNTILLSIVVISFFMFYGGELEELIYWSILFIFIESLMILLVVVNLTMVTNTIMAVIYSLCIYATGHALPQTLKLKYVEMNPIFIKVIEFYEIVFPNLSRLNIKKFVLYEQALSLDFLLTSFFYGISYTLFLYFIAATLFTRKSLD